MWRMKSRTILIGRPIITWLLWIVFKEKNILSCVLLVLKIIFIFKPSTKTCFCNRNKLVKLNYGIEEITKG